MFPEINRLSKQNIRKTLRGKLYKTWNKQIPAKFCFVFFPFPISLFFRSKTKFQISLSYSSITFTSISCPSTPRTSLLPGCCFVVQRKQKHKDAASSWISSCAVELRIDLPLGTSASVSESIWNYL